ncbi:MAG: DUF2752 domain-containing protein [Lachnospiraceae bacterium]|nr:DUF2752 domain-containing protein [Lachnospiraceae bacterium]
MPKCSFHVITGGWCPACGNTRCVRYLLQGDFFMALRHNITIPFLGVLLLLLYLENLAAISGRDAKFYRK